MKKASILALILVLTATLFAGCGNNGKNPTSTNPTTKPMTTNTTVAELPLPTKPGTTDPASGNATDPSSTGMPGRSVRPSAKAPRY